MEVTLRTAYTVGKLLTALRGSPAGRHGPSPVWHAQSARWLRWLNWGERIAARYAGLNSFRDGEAMRLLRLHTSSAGRAPVATSAFSRVTLHNAWPVHLQLNLSVPAVREIVVRGRQELPGPEAAKQATRPAGPAYITYVTGNSHTERLAGRLAEHEAWALKLQQEYPVVERVLAHQQASGPGKERAPGPWEIVPAPEKIVAQPQVSQPAERVERSGPGANPSLPYWSSHPAATGQPAGQSDVSISALTDRVIQALDTRVIAARERLGKR